jgi:hypothetical protein
MFYYTSKRAVLSYNYSFEKWMSSNPKQTKITGLVLLAFAYSLWFLSMSLCSGTLLFFIQLMTISSLIIILKPLKVINSKTVAVLFVLAGLFEIYYY